MTRTNHTPSRLPHTFLPAVLVSLALSLLCAGGLYYLLARHDRAEVMAHTEALDKAAEEKAKAISRTFAWFTEALLGENLADVQRAIDLHIRPAGVLDAVVIAENNVIVAAKTRSVVGRRIQDAGWMTARATQGEVIAKGIEQGRPAITVVEPLRDRDRIVAWTRLVFSAPQQHAAFRSADDLAGEVALYVLPFFVLMTVLLALTLRGMISQIRLLIARVLMDAMESGEVPLGSSRLPRLG